MKKFTAILCTAFMALSLTACGGKEKTVTVDAEKLASELMDAAVTSDTLTKAGVDLSTIYFYDPADVENAVSYASSGTTACEVTVIESKDASMTGDMEKLIQTRVDNQKALYETYNAAEAEKLDNAIIKSAGNYTVLCVCDETEKANELLKEYGF